MKQNRRHRARQIARKKGNRQKPHLFEHNSMSRKAQDQIDSSEQKTWSGEGEYSNYSTAGLTVSPM